MSTFSIRVSVDRVVAAIADAIGAGCAGDTISAVIRWNAVGFTATPQNFGTSISMRWLTRGCAIGGQVLPALQNGQ